MKSRIIHILILVICFSGATLRSQTDKDKLDALRVNFITKRLDLSTRESEQFWPVYNEYNDKIRAIKTNVRMAYRKISPQTSDKEAEEIYHVDVLSKQAEADVHKIYSQRLRLILGTRKFLRLRMAEEDFKREIINTIKERSE